MTSDKFIVMYDGNLMNVEEGLTLWVPCDVSEEAVYGAALRTDYLDDLGMAGGDPAMQIFNTPTVNICNGRYTTSYRPSGRFLSMYDSGFMEWRSTITFYVPPMERKAIDKHVTTSMPYRALARRPFTQTRNGHAGYVHMAVPTDVLHL